MARNATIERDAHQYTDGAETEFIRLVATLTEHISSSQISRVLMNESPMLVLLHKCRSTKKKCQTLRRRHRSKLVWEMTPLSHLMVTEMSNGSHW